MSEKTVITEIPEEFKKVIGDFISDISNTFPSIYQLSIGGGRQKKIF